MRSGKRAYVIIREGIEKGVEGTIESAVWKCNLVVAGINRNPAEGGFARTCYAILSTLASAAMELDSNVCLRTKGRNGYGMLVLLRVRCSAPRVRRDAFDLRTNRARTVVFSDLTIDWQPLFSSNACISV